MAFKSGAEWNGNRSGAPKKEFRRDVLTEKMVNDHQEDAKEITDVWLNCAKAGQPWAIKEFIRIWYTPPKSRDEAEVETHAALVSQLAEIPSERLAEARKLLRNLLTTEMDLTRPHEVV